ncbi:MAG: leucyl aminopeptidase [Alphaproteobacteria bacterium]|nr:leucyl aminopeptidase [Alphaproteobacteria bacterium]
MVKLTYTHSNTELEIQAIYKEELKDKSFSTAAANAKFKAEQGEVMHFPDDNVLLAGLGSKKDKLDTRKIGGAIGAKLIALEIADAQINISQKLDLDDIYWITYATAIRAYKFDKYKSEKKTKLTNLAVLGAHANAIKKSDLQALVEEAIFARDLSNEPANILTPRAFAAHAKDAAKLGLKIEILDEAQLKKLNMNLILAVGQGSPNKPYVAVMTHMGDTKSRTINNLLVGKGLCFDSGGVNIKPPKGGMTNMHADMTGAACVLAAMRLAARAKLKTNVVGIIGMVESMPDGAAFKPTDIIKSYSGKTVEIIDTDAEGRMVLGDCAAYGIKRFKPARIVDIATLTGAARISLADQYAGLFTNDDKLCEQILAAGDACGERCWRLPAGKAFADMNKSDVADIANYAGTSYGGSSTGAEFVHAFCGDTPWAHLDIASVDDASAKAHHLLSPAGPTGFGASLLYYYLKGSKNA